MEEERKFIVNKLFKFICIDVKNSKKFKIMIGSCDLDEKSIEKNYKGEYYLFVVIDLEKDNEVKEN